MRFRMYDATASASNWSSASSPIVLRPSVKPPTARCGAPATYTDGEEPDTTLLYLATSVFAPDPDRCAVRSNAWRTPTSRLQRAVIMTTRTSYWATTDGPMLIT